MPTISALNFGSAVINEGGTATLSGAIGDVDIADHHTVTVNWGDGSSPLVDTLNAGTLAFALSHVYANNPSGKAQNGTFVAQATVSNGVSVSAVASTSVSVDNVAPAIDQLSMLNNGTVVAAINEGQTITLNGTLSDPGMLDSQTIVVNWGDGTVNASGTLVADTTAFALAAGVTAFSATHPYANNPAGAPNGMFAISVTDTDSDGGVGAAGTGITVHNVAPVLTGITSSATAVTQGGSITMSASFTDPGTLDTHTVIGGLGRRQRRGARPHDDRAERRRGDVRDTSASICQQLRHRTLRRARLRHGQ